MNGNLKEKIDGFKQDQAEATGRKNAKMEELKTKYGFDTIEEAQAGIAEKQQKEQDLRQQAERKEGELYVQYPALAEN